MTRFQHIRQSAVLLDIRLSAKMHIKSTLFNGFIPKYKETCETVGIFYSQIFMPLAFIVLQIKSFLHGTFLLLILCQFLSIHLV